MIKNTLLIILLSLFLTGCTTIEPQLKIETVMQEAKAAYQAKNWKLAEEKFALLVSLMPGEAEFWYKLGNIYAHTNQPAKAITAYKEVIIRNTKFTKAWHNLSVMSLRQTTHLFIEMLQYMDPNDPLFKIAKETGNDLLAIMKKRQNGKPVKLGEFPPTIPDKLTPETKQPDATPHKQNK